MSLVKRKQSGDTIVEVLIVLAIVGLALSISYAIANKSFLGVRQSQEHSEALQLAQSQLEELRSYIVSLGSNPTPTQLAAIKPSSSSSYFCFPNSDSLTPTGFFSLSTPPTSSDFGDCFINNLYGTGISYDSGTSQYTSQVQWDDVTGDGRDNVSLIYRITP